MCSLSYVHVYRIEYVSYRQGPYRIHIVSAADVSSQPYTFQLSQPLLEAVLTLDISSIKLTKYWIYNEITAHLSWAVLESGLGLGHQLVDPGILVRIQSLQPDDQGPQSQLDTDRDMLECTSSAFI